MDQKATNSNLIPFTDLTEEQRREMAKKAGRASGAARAELARSSELFVRVFGLTPRLGEAAL